LSERPLHRAARHHTRPRATDTTHHQKIAASQAQAVARLGQPGRLRMDDRIGGEGRPAIAARAIKTLARQGETTTLLRSKDHGDDPAGSPA
jgi:hypothetical protein